MGWLDNLKARVGAVTISVAGAKGATKKKMPRDTVLAAIDHSIAYHKDPKYVLPAGKGKGKSPTPIYKIDGTKANIQLPYGKSRLKFGRVGDQIAVDANKLGDALEQLRADVAEGAWDKQLAKLQAAKAGAAKRSTPVTTPSARSTPKANKPKKAK